MDRVAVFVDAGYLFAQGSVALTGKKLPRGSITIDHKKAIAALEDFAQDKSGLPLLRIFGTTVLQPDHPRSTLHSLTFPA